MLVWRIPLFGPSWNDTFEAFCKALHGPKRPSHDSLLAALASLEAAHRRDWHESFAQAVKAHSLQPNGLWRPLLEVTQPPIWHWFAFWSRKIAIYSLFPLAAPDSPSGAQPQQPNLT